MISNSSTVWNLARFALDWIVGNSASGEVGRTFWQTAHLNSDMIICRSFFTVARSASSSLRWSNPSSSVFPYYGLHSMVRG